MKNGNHKVKIGLFLSPLLLAFVGLFSYSKQDNQVNAYTPTSLSKMDIDTNDSTESEIRSYYSSLTSLTNGEKKGTNLLKNLKPILKNNQTYFGYNDTIWKLYEITDRDWNKSPATSITNGTYNPSTKIIADYQFKATGVDPYIHALYNDRTIDNVTTAYSNHLQNPHGINREHVWAKSHGFNDEENWSGGAVGDPMHLMAGDGYTNNLHSNYCYGYVDLSESYRNSKTSSNTSGTYEYTGNNYLGDSKTKGSEYTVFEPQDSDKGDIARACFYMAARYNNYASELEGFDVNEPNLILDDSCSMTTGTSTATTPFSLGILSDLLEWNKIDPPDEYEIHRNNLLYKNFTHNRNPFIDFPDWADIIWGSSNNSANPNTDVINGNIVLSSIEVTTQPNKTTYVEGESFDPTGMVITAKYNDSSTSVVSSSDYTISPSGSLTTSNTSITITYQGKTAICYITVQSSSQSSQINLTRYTGDFYPGDYVFYSPSSNSSGYIMGNSISSNRITSSQIVEPHNHLSITSSDYIWNISMVDSNYIIKNVSNNKYLVSTGTKNQAGLSDTITDKAYWSLEASNGEYYFTNNFNKTNEVNSYLKNNTTFGFATYASTFTTKIYLYRVDNTQMMKTIDPLDLSTGDIISFIGKKESVAGTFVPSSYNNSYLLASSNGISNVGDYYSVPSDLYTFEVLKVGSYYAFHSKDGYLKYTPNNSDLVSFSDTIEDGDNTVLFTVAYSSTSLNYLIRNVQSNTKYLRYTNNSGNQIFKFGGSSLGDKINIIQLREQGEVDAWSKLFLSSTINCSISSWSTLEECYNSLPINSKTILENVVADPSSSASYAAQAMARYEYILSDSRFNSSLTSFVTNRNTSTSSRHVVLFNIPNIFESKYFVFIVCSVFIGSLTVVSYYKFNRGRKLNNE